MVLRGQSDPVNFFFHQTLKPWDAQKSQCSPLDKAEFGVQNA